KTTTKLSRFGVTAIIYFVIGIFLLFVTIIPSANVFGFVIGGLVLLFGICSFTSKVPTDRNAGIILVIIGALTLASKMNIPFVSDVSKILLLIGAIGIIALAVWNGIKFFIGLKKRA
ncbi:MAG: hypothetical protein FWD24_05740, partial [Treponema sp.]|nr:hypothetical protein [Treponema sp.]